MQIYVIYIGGKHPQSLIEVHDVRIVTASSIEETYSSLRSTWWGVPESLHLDCWGVLRSVENYHVYLRDEQPIDLKKLYFVNLGGYDATQFTELHNNIFVIAADEAEAKLKAKKTIQSWSSPHRDYIHDVDDVLEINSIAASQHLYLHFEPTENPSPFEFVCQYVSIGK